MAAVFRVSESEPVWLVVPLEPVVEEPPLSQPANASKKTMSKSLDIKLIERAMRPSLERRNTSVASVDLLRQGSGRCSENL